MTKKKLPDVYIPETDVLQHRFSFIENEILRDNIVIKMQYISFLLSLEEEYDLPSSTIYSTFKTIIIYTASIIEGVLHYSLEKYFEKNPEQKEKHLKTKKFHKHEQAIFPKEYKGLYAVQITETIKDLSENEDFIQLNRIAQKIDLINDEQFKSLEKIRNVRNNIHLYSLKKTDNGYSKEDMNYFFTIVKDILKAVEDFEYSKIS